MKLFRYRKPSLNRLLGISRAKSRFTRATGGRAVRHPEAVVENFERRAKRRIGYYSGPAKGGPQPPSLARLAQALVTTPADVSKVSHRIMLVVFVAVCSLPMLRITLVAAQTPGPLISSPTVALSPAIATVGDQLTLTITIEHDTGVTVMAPGVGASFGGLELVSKAPPSTADAAAGRSLTTYVYTLAAFSTGTLTVPALTLDYTSPDGSAGTVATEATTVTISSVLAGDDTDLRPLKPQLSLDSGAPSPAAPVMFVAAFALLTAAGYGLHRRAAARTPATEMYGFPVPPAPHEAARAALDALAVSGLAATDPDEYYARIAATVRRYLSARFGFPAYAMTRRELDREMRRAGVDPWPARLTSNVLTEADAVQFASFRPAPERRDADLTAAYEIIALTADAPEDSRPGTGGDPEG